MHLRLKFKANELINIFPTNTIKRARDQIIPYVNYAFGFPENYVINAHVRH